MAIDGLKTEGEIDPRIIYASLFVIAGVALISPLGASRASSIASAFVVVIVALGNISYLYSRFKKRNSIREN